MPVAVKKPAVKKTTKSAVKKTVSKKPVDKKELEPVVVPARQGAYAAGVNFLLPGWVAPVPLDLVPSGRPNSSGEASFPFACPECETPTSLSRAYLCSENEDHGPFKEKGLPHYRNTVNGPIWVSDEQITYVRTGGMEEKSVVFHAHPVEDVVASTLPSGACYRVRVGKDASVLQRNVAGMLTVLASDENIALVGVLLVRGVRQMFRLQVWKGQLMLFGLVHPDDLGAVDDLLDLSDEVVDGANVLRESLDVVPFEPAVYRWNVLDAVDEIVRGGGVERPARKDVAAAADLNAFISSALGAPKKRKKVSRSNVTAAG